MWYINKSYSKKKKIEALGFYINYVVYKSHTDIQNIDVGKGFILTMWYINLLIRLSVYKNTPCFILTMWYIN